MPLDLSDEKPPSFPFSLLRACDHRKDIILGQNKRKEEEKAPLVAAQAPGAEKVDVAKVANELSRDENAVKIMQAIKTLSPNDLEALKGAIKMGNQPASASQEEKSAKRVRTE